MENKGDEDHRKSKPNTGGVELGGSIMKANSLHRIPQDDHEGPAEAKGSIVNAIGNPRTTIENDDPRESKSILMKTDGSLCSNKWSVCDFHITCYLLLGGG